MKEIITWEEMKKKYPDQWLLIVDYQTDKSGHIMSGVVARHSKKKDEVFEPPALKKAGAFKYTGESQFPGGWRVHAKHNHI